MRINQRRFHVFTRPPEREGVGGGLGSTGGTGPPGGREGTERQSERREGGAGRAWDEEMRGKRDKQGQVFRGPPLQDPAHSQRGAPHFLSLPVCPAPGSPECPAPSYGPGPRQPLAAPPVSGRCQVGSVPTSWGRQRESRQDQARRGEGREWGAPQSRRQQKEGGPGKESTGGWERERAERKTQGRREGRGGGKRRKKTSYIDMTLSLPGRLKILSPPNTSWYRCLAPPHTRDRSSAGWEGPPLPQGRDLTPRRSSQREKDKTPGAWPEVAVGTHVSSRTNWLCDLRATSCPLWAPVSRPTCTHTFPLKTTCL